MSYNLPFDPINMKDESEFDTSFITTDPLKHSEIQYQKRQGNYLYIYIQTILKLFQTII